MPNVRVKVETRGGPGEVSADLADAQKESYARVGEIWHRRMIPRHFEVSAVGRYGYAPRSRKYMIRKARAKGHQRPLVWSGTTERMIKSRVEIRSGAKPPWAQVKMFGPRWLYAYHKTLGAGDKAAELTAITSDEERQLDEFVRIGISRRFNALRHGTRKVL